VRGIARRGGKLEVLADVPGNSCAAGLPTCPTPVILTPSFVIPDLIGNLSLLPVTIPFLTAILWQKREWFGGGVWGGIGCKLMSPWIVR